MHSGIYRNPESRESRYTPHRAAERVRVRQMELCERGVKRKSVLWKPNDQVSKGLGLKGTNMTSRATLGLDALYSAVGSDARRKRACPLVSPDVPPCRNAAEEAMERPPFRRGSPTRLVWTSPKVTTPLLGFRYKYVSTIGRGKHADVIRAEDTFRPGRSMAIKVLNIGCEAIGVRELRCMRLLGSVPHAESRPVARLLDVLTLHGHVCLVMELLDGTLHPYTQWDASRRPRGAVVSSALEGGSRALAASRSLGEVVGKGPGTPWTGAPPSDFLWTSATDGLGSDCEGGVVGRQQPGGCPIFVVRHVALQLVSALMLLYDHGLIHADIKPENILLGIGEDHCCRGRLESFRLEDCMHGRVMASLESGWCSPARLKVKLCDFGNTIHRSEASQYYTDFDIQTLPYRAPEVLMGCPFGTAIDTWSVGIILLELLLGRSLFRTTGSRAALLRQSLCAFGPLPMRRFRVGRYFSEYFNQDQSLKEGEDDKLMGCCACCWVGEIKGEDEANGQLKGQSCSGSCAQKCRSSNSLAGIFQSEDGQGGGMGESLPVRRSAIFPLVKESSTSQRPSWQVAHTHLRRLFDAAEVSAPAKKGGFSTSGSHGIARRNPHLLSFLAGMLCYDPDERLTPLQALAHPFFSDLLPFTVPITSAAREVPKVAMAKEAIPRASSKASDNGTPAVRYSVNESTLASRCDDNVNFSAGKSWGDTPKLSSSLPRPFPTFRRPINQPGSAVGPDFQDSGYASAQANPVSLVTRDSTLVFPHAHNKETFIGVTISSSALVGTRDAGNISPTPLSRLAETAEVVARRGSNTSSATRGCYREGDRSSSTSSADAQTASHRNLHLNAPLAAASTSGPARPETSDIHDGTPTRQSTGRALVASRASPAVSSVRRSGEARVCHHEDNCRSNIPSAVAPAMSRRDGYLKAPLAESARRASSVDLSPKATLAPECAMKGAEIPSTVTSGLTEPTAARGEGVAPPVVRRRNRFLTPAALAKLNPVLRDRITEAMATAERAKVKHTDPASAETPSSPKGRQVSLKDDGPLKSKRHKTMAPRTQEKSRLTDDKKSSPKERSQKLRRSTRGQSIRNGKGRALSTAKGSGRKISTPRRPAVTAGVAPSLSRNEDAESYDCGR